MRAVFTKIVGHFLTGRFTGSLTDRLSGRVTVWATGMGTQFTTGSLVVLLIGVTHTQAASPVAFTTHSLTNQSTTSSRNWFNQLPDMTQRDGLIDSQHSRQVGEWALRQINADVPRVNDPWLQQTLEQLVWQLNATVRQDAPLALVMINDRQINAFAVPSGLIGINVGLLDKARNLDEVASVIAHEIAHVSQRHYQHRNDEKTNQRLMQLGGILATIAAAKSGEQNAGAAMMMGTQAMSANTSAAFSRSQEQEADRIGMQILAQAGYDVNAMPNFFSLLNQQLPLPRDAFIPSFIMSHPPTPERIAEARQRATTYPIVSTNANKLASRKQQFDQLQWRSRYLAALTNKVELSQAAKTNDGAKLALIDLLIDERNQQQAEQLLQHFAVQITTLQNPLAVILQAKLWQQQGKRPQAIQKLTALANLQPERRDIQLYLADSYLSDTPTPANAQQVITNLQPLARQYPHDLGIWQRLQHASQILAKTEQGTAKTLHQINVLHYRANQQFWQNNLTDAITSLTQAKTLAQQLPNNTATLAILNQRIAQVQQANQFEPS